MAAIGWVLDHPQKSEGFRASVRSSSFYQLPRHSPQKLELNNNNKTSSLSKNMYTIIIVPDIEELGCDYVRTEEISLATVAAKSWRTITSLFNPFVVRGLGPLPWSTFDISIFDCLGSVRPQYFRLARFTPFLADGYFHVESCTLNEHFCPQARNESLSCWWAMTCEI